MLDDELKESGMHVDEGEEEEALDPATGLPIKKDAENPDPAEDEEEDDDEKEEEEEM